MQSSTLYCDIMSEVVSYYSDVYTVVSHVIVNYPRQRRFLTVSFAN